jgi:hypothetical protein
VLVSPAENALKAASLLAALDVTAYGNQHGESRQAESGVSDFQNAFSARAEEAAEEVIVRLFKPRASAFQLREPG